ncbi:signal recognition particle, SRP19 subunit [Linderina pennispora]|uniref:Signal recognition particle, SRP19 subunit n=1 Tax=Linderina pennispora TaxID=61395 RepID=A0A1Y1WMQ2_9FUNG|nr:signal recognition particle, SRP19 subunit [Linderina pennispora]ORX74793.1 signal recognition particle, SRP19 subunit [Linderina pennispora]
MAGKAVDLDVDDMDFPLPEQQSRAFPAEGIRIGQSLGGVKFVNDESRFKRWVCLYPLYFDKARSVEQGRKVPQSLAVEQPFARQIAAAVKEVGFNVCYEPGKTHPRDFFNPGRVRVQLFDEEHRPVRHDIQTRKKLMRYVAERMPHVSAEREKEPTLQDLIDSGAMPVLPGMPPPGANNDEEEPAAQPKPGKQKKNKKKGKAKHLV